jgi:YcaO-like protein with predicted kinase domain
MACRGSIWPRRWSLDDASGIRRRHPREVVEMIRPYFGEFGITRLGQVTGLDRVGIPVWSAFRPNARSLAVSQGKGLDDDGARASALMEAVELATAESPRSPSLRCSQRDLEARGLFSAPLATLVAKGCRAPLPDEAMEWRKGLDIINGVEVWVPGEAVMLDHTRDLSTGQAHYWMSTDGLASGTTLGEAILHGLLERIERDATTLWEFATKHKLDGCCLDPDDFASAEVRMLAKRFADAGLALRLFDVTTDLGVPAVLAVVAEINPPARRHFEVVAGSAAHLSLAAAASRAMTEAAQARLTIIAGARDDFPPDDYAREVEQATLDLVAACPSPGRPARPRAIAPSTLSGLCARLAEARVGPVIAVPLSHPDAPFSVVKVVVEGLESGPGARAKRYGRRAVRAMMRGGP